MNRYVWESRLRGCMRPGYLSQTEYVVLMMLATYTDKSGQGAAPAAARLASDCGKSVNTIRRALASLVEKGYILVARQGGGHRRPTEYALVEDVPHAADLPTQTYPSEPTYLPIQMGSRGVPIPTHLDGYEQSDLPTHPDRLTYPSEPTYLPIQMGTDQVDQERNQEIPSDDDYVSRSLTAREHTPSPSTRIPAEAITGTPPPPAPRNPHRDTVHRALGNAEPPYPDATIDQLARHVAKLAGRHAPQLLHEAIQRWDTTPGAKPSWLPTILGDVVKDHRARAAPTPLKPSTTDNRIAAAQALKTPEEQSPRPAQIAIPGPVRPPAATTGVPAPLHCP